MRGYPFVVLALIGCSTSSDDSGQQPVEDEPSPCVESLWFVDADSDGYGNPANTLLACESRDGLVGNGGDCDDTDPLVQHGVIWWSDLDRDGFGNAAAPVEACAAPALTVDNDLDCDDADPDVRPDAEERCNGVDDDCSGVTDGPDAVDARPFYVDLDGDGHAAVDATASVNDCQASEGYSELRDDCDDNDPDVMDPSPWYVDVDGDGYGSTVGSTGCEGGTGEVSAGGDCDELDPDVNPGATEVCNKTDDDCDGLRDEAFADLDFDATIADISLNGDAGQAFDGIDGSVVLTDAAGEASSAYLSTPIPWRAWYASVVIEASGGTGGEGLALVFLDESDPTLLGNDDAGLAVEGATGWAVVLDTHRNNGSESADNWLSLRDASDMSVVVTGNPIPDVHDGGAQRLEVWFDDPDLVVAIDGVTYLEAVLPGPFPTAWQMGVTSTTSDAWDQHTIDDLYVGCPR